MNRPAFPGLLFDKDGTLFDYQKSWGGFTLRFIEDLAGDDAGLALRLADTMGIDPVTGRFSPESAIVAGTPAEVVEPLVPLLPGWTFEALTARINAAASEAPQVPAADLGALFDQLRGAGHVLGIATNDAEVAARAHLKAAGVAAHFTFLAGYDSGHGAKPAPNMCRAFAAEVGLAPAQCVMVGDSLHDMMAGRAAGMTCVAVCTGITPAKDLAPQADAVLPHIGHLPAWLAAR
ncbi:HAD family hydrolase [Vannielia litorea]|uniref:HAD family hydrolase n=1 Tax=Vannielia litorea TaxID=1217970 RepID=UPI001BCBA25C|nr:HAD family hydrolase [Vannielia litorea]MBS8225423.1 HAD family hydrolase [Vannielia litorea]